MKYNYQIMQGLFSKSGVGDETCIAEASTRAEANKLFNKIKHDTKGYSKARGYKVVTTLLKNDEYEYSEIVDLYEVILWL